LREPLVRENIFRVSKSRRVLFDIVKRQTIRTSDRETGRATFIFGVDRSARERH
jgi:hypothetical protein